MSRKRGSPGVRKSESPEDEPKAERPKRKAVKKPVQKDSFGEVENPKSESLDTFENTKSDPPTGGLHSEINKSEIEHPKSEIIMEVHHHPDLHHEKKPWKEYLLEGLMIFLAVMMGFFAEGYREHVGDRTKETEYMSSLVRDLRNDIREIKFIKKVKLSGISYVDSALRSFENGDYKRKTADLYFWTRMLGLRNFFVPNDGTIQQLNNAGGLRLIHKRNVLDSLQRYIIQTRALLSLQELEELEITSYKESFSVIFDAQATNKMYSPILPGKIAFSAYTIRLKKLNYNPPLMSYDKSAINIMNMKSVIIKGIRISQIGYLDIINTRAYLLIDLIKKEYNLENE